MKAEFEKQLNQLLGVRKERTLLMTDDRYNELVAETKEANERRRRGLELSGIHYRRLKRFDVMTIGGREKLVQKNEKGGQSSQKVYFCMASEMFDVMHNAHLKIGHKKEKGMELELKRKYCNITREVIGIYLSLCQDCALKKKCKARSLLGVKPTVEPPNTSRCQIEIIDMESEPDGAYKFILTYQDCQSKFLILRPMTTKTPEEVADVLFDIFCLIGVPSMLLCEPGYCNKILHSLSENWKVILLKGQPQQDTSVWRDILKSLVDWMSEHRTRNWAPGLRIIQSVKNRCFNPSIQRTPHEAMFGQTQITEVPLEETAKVQTEKELKEKLALLQQKLDEVNDLTKDMMKNFPPSPRTERFEDSVQEPETKCLRCNKGLSPEVFCWRCNGPLHFNCALTTDYSENPFCQFCASRTAVQIPKRGQKRRLEDESPALFPSDRPSHITHHRPSIGNKNAILERLFYRNESQLSGSMSPIIEANGFTTKRHKSKSTKKSKRQSKSTQCNFLNK